MTNFWILMLVAITISTASQFYIKKNLVLINPAGGISMSAIHTNGPKSFYLLYLCFHSPFSQLNICFYYFLL